MKTLYLDCGMGAAGDMLTAALLELFPDPDGQVNALNVIGIPQVVFEAQPTQKCGICGTRVRVRIDGAEESESLHEHPHEHAHEHNHEHEHDHEHDHDHEHHHAHHSLADIEAMVLTLQVSDRVKADVLNVYRSIAEAESAAHGRPVSEIHFHEVGATDAVADVTAVCFLMERLAIERVIASPVHVGSGTVRCAHGVLPVPAPATALLLKDIPIYGGEISGELCTPTGAALLKHFVQEFGDMPIMRVERIGYGMGAKDFSRANCVRALLGEMDQTDTETMFELSVNVDDMTAEQIGFASERLFEAGAVEVYTIPVGMKKSRPGTLLRAICPPDKREAVVSAFFRHTTTLGVRETQTRRYVMDRHIEQRHTPLGTVRVKCADGYGVTREKIEYEDLARIARERGLSLAQAQAAVEQEIEA